MNKLPVQKLNFVKLTETHFRKHTDKQESTKILRIFALVFKKGLNFKDVKTTKLPLTSPETGHGLLVHLPDLLVPNRKHTEPLRLLH